MLQRPGSLRADEASARADPDLKSAIDLYGEVTAALGISDECPRYFDRKEVAFIKVQIRRYAGFVYSLSRQHKIPPAQTATRLNSLGQNNVDQARREASIKGCTSPRIERTVQNIKRMRDRAKSTGK